MYSYLDKRELTKLRKTRQHYNAFPYEVGVRNSQAYTSSQSHLGRFISKIAGKSVIDIGCGPGNLLPTLGGHTRRTIGLDLSQRSLHRATEVIDNLPVSLGQGSALELPFSDQSFDVVVATGSLHCTPDPRAAFIEACRVLRPGGLGYVALYHAGSYYDYLYHTLGSLIRACETFWLTAFLINRCLILPLFILYFVAGRLLVHGKLVIPSYTHTLNYFADQFLSPIVSFHEINEITEWTQAAGVEIVDVSYSHAGALINVEIRRPDAL